MSGNTFGKLFSVTTFGESHGKAIGCIIDGCPPGIKINLKDIQKELNRRKPGSSKYVTQRNEEDKVKILSGFFNNQTTGTPIALLIKNKDTKSKDYNNIIDTFRPGHADYTYWKKYGIRDHRGGGRSSARLTAPIVAAGAIAKKFLKKKCDIKINGYLSELGKINIPFINMKYINCNDFFSPNLDIIPKLKKYIKKIKKKGDSIGARINIIVSNMLAGLGNPLFNKLDASIAHAMMGINAVKGIEIGSGFNSILQYGSTHGDEITPKGFTSNNSGGILGGISTGQDISISIAVKPTPSINIPLNSINTEGKPVIIKTIGRHDVCVGIRIVPIVEAIISLTLIDHFLINIAQCNDVMIKNSKKKKKKKKNKNKKIK